MFLKIVFKVYLILFTFFGVLTTIYGIYGFISSLTDNTPYKTWYLMSLIPLGIFGIVVTSGVSLFQYFRKSSTYKQSLIPLISWGLTIMVIIITLIIDP